jgi:peptidoglycan/LPS O-acetylase OafA/YrhL
MSFLGQLSFSIFIWQNLFMMFGFMAIMAAPTVPGISFWVAVIGLLVMSMISTYFIEKPLARKLRGKYPSVRESAAVPASGGHEVS